MPTLHPTLNSHTLALATALGELLPKGLAEYLRGAKAWENCIASKDTAHMAMPKSIRFEIMNGFELAISISTHMTEVTTDVEGNAYEVWWFTFALSIPAYTCGGVEHLRLLSSKIADCVKLVDDLETRFGVPVYEPCDDLPAVPESFGTSGYCTERERWGCD